jgi:hypothetical protein
MDAWFFGVLGALLLAILSYVIKLTADVAGVKRELEICKPLELKATVDRIVYRQELADMHAIEGMDSPHAPERDSLLDRIRCGEALTVEELERAAQLLREARVAERSADKRWYATTLLARVETDLSRRRSS